MSLFKGFALVGSVILGLIALDYVLFKWTRSESPPSALLTMQPTPEESGFAEYLVDIINEAQKTRDWSRFDAACDLEEFARRVAGSTALSEPMRNLVRSHIQGDEFLGPRNALRDFFSSLQATCLRIRVVDGERRPLFRLMHPTGSPGYLECIIETRQDSGRRLVDLHLYSAGRRASAYFADLLLPATKSLDVLNSLRAPTFFDIQASRPERWRYAELFNARKAKEAEQWFRENAGALSKDRSTLLLRLQWTALLKSDGHPGALQDFERAFPNDPALVFNRFAAFRQSREFEDALKAVDGMEREVGGDPYLDILRAIILSEADRNAEAQACAQKCTEAEPTLSEGWYVRCSLAFKKQLWGEAAALLKLADQSTVLDLERLAALDGYQAFSGTEEFMEWLANRPRNKK